MSMGCEADRDSLSWYEATARQRIGALADAGTFHELMGPAERRTSPHLALFDLPVQFDDGMIVGSGLLGGRAVFIAAQEGRFMGGSFGEVHGAKLTGLLRAAGKCRRDVLLLLDTGGVRLQEANAGEVAIAEVMRAIVQARLAGIRVIGLIGGRAGCYGGGSLIAGCCSSLIMSEQGRLAVSGPEVIETNRGVEEFDSSDRALIWRTMGGKHRYLMGSVDRFVGDAAAAFRQAALAALAGEDACGAQPTLTLDALRREQLRLEQRLDRFGTGMTDAMQLWEALGIEDPSVVPELGTVEFTHLADNKRIVVHDAR